MPTISEMRLYLMSRYPNSLKWHKKVTDMPTRQIVAIYRNLKRRADKVNVNFFNNEPEDYHQIDMFEYLASLNQTRTEVNV